MTPDRQRAPAGQRRLIIIDELPYLLRHSPEIPSVLQELWDESRHSPGAAVIVCGSALSVMTELLSGQRALRGRARLNLLIKPFDYRTSAEYWGATNPEVALRLGAIFGGTPGYKALIEHAPPRSTKDLASWLGRSILKPAHALYDEMSYLLREDPRIQDKALYNSILRAIADGATTASKIGALIGRRDSALTHPLDVLITAGFLHRDEDLLLQRRPSYRIADPIVRFSQLVVEPNRVSLEEGQVQEAWRATESSFSAGVLGPYFEHIAGHWTRHYSEDHWPEPIGEVGRTVVNDPQGKAQHELDVVALRRGVRKQSARPEIVVLGEAKCTNGHRTLSDLARLDHIRGLLTRRGVGVEKAVLALFSRSGFEGGLQKAAAKRDDVRLIDLPTLFGR